MLLDMLGIVIGFSTVMLFLSLIVTALVQSTLAISQLRGRVLRSTLGMLISSDDTPDTQGALGMMAESVGQSISDRRFDAVRHLSCSAISRAQFSSLYASRQIASNQKPTSTTDSSEAFDLMEDLSSSRFSVLARYISIFWAIVIAVIFQVSSPDLITQLARDDALRSQYILAGEQLIERQVVPSVEEFQLREAAVRAKSNLALEYPGVTEVLDNPIGFGDSIESLLAEMEIALDGIVSDADPILKVYEELLAEEIEEDIAEYKKQTLSAVNELSLLDIRPWRNGRTFYWNKSGLQANTVFGVLITSIFLTFGAPFWFQRLKEASDLKNSLAKRRSS